MKLHDDGEFIALNWVKQALDATLAQARQALETYVDNPVDLEPMRACAALLHQVQGSLHMVELYGAAMVVENMERLAEGLIADRVSQREESYSVLMRGMVQLPDYLERLQSGHKDIPIVLLPLLNDLRACRGENLLTESALFAPDLAIALPHAADGRAQPLAPGELRAQALRLRLAFQAALLKWFRDEGAAEHLNRLMDVLDRLRVISAGSDARRLWWIAAGTIEAVENGGLEASVAVKLLFGRVDREIHRFARDGEAGFAAAPPRELIKNLLYYVAHSGDAGAFPDGTRSAQIRSAYQLDTLLPTPGELQHAQGSMSGHNRSLLGTVSAAIKDDLLRVKEALDIFLRGGHADPGELETQVELLDRVGDTLGMLGLGMPRRVVGEQRDIIGEMARRQRPVDEGTLLDVAGALLYVEASLDDHIDRLGASDSSESGGGALELPQAEVRRILDALMREASVNIEQAKHDIVAFIESPWEHARVGQIPRLLEEIAGALRMLGLADPAELMTAVVRFVEVELITHRRVPTAEQMDTLADALAAIEYYLEAVREQRRNRDKILDVARESLAALGYWPLPAAAADDLAQADAALDGDQRALQHAVEFMQSRSDDAYLAAAIVEHDVATDGAERAAHDHGLPTIEMLPGADLHDLMIGDAGVQESLSHDLSGLRLAETAAGAGDPDDWAATEPGPALDAPALGGFEQAAGEEIDDDIRAVFVEEVEEELANMQRQLPLWKRDVDNLDELKPLRRSFHTLKGSGRLVGALALGEFSWKVEGLLNRVLDRSVAPGSAVVALIEHAVAAVPELLAALRGEHGGSANIAGIMATADRLATGEEAWLDEHSGETAQRPAAPTAQESSTFSDDNLAGEAPFGAPLQEVVAGPLPNVDPVLFDILQSEVAAHLGIIEDYLTRSELHAMVASEPLLRAAHTLNGAIAMVDIPAVGNVLGPLESYVKRLRGAGAAPAADGLAALRDTVTLTREVMQRLTAGDADLPDSSALASRMAALRDALPEADALLYWHDDAEAEAEVAGDTAAEAGFDLYLYDVPVPAEEALQPPADMRPVETDFTGAWLQDAHRTGGASAAADTPIPADVAASLAALDASSRATLAHPGDVPAIALDSVLDVPSATMPPFADSFFTEAALADALDEAQNVLNERGDAARPVDDVQAESIGTGFAGTDETAESLQAAEVAECVEADEATEDAVAVEVDMADVAVDFAAAGEADHATEVAAATRVDTADETADFAAANEAVGGELTFDTADIDAAATTAATQSWDMDDAAGVAFTTSADAPDAAAAPDQNVPALSAFSDAALPAAQVDVELAADQNLAPADSAEGAAETVAFAAAEPAPADVATPAPPRGALAGDAPPPLADDPQPDGVLTVADIDDDLLDIFVQEGTDILDHSDSLVAGLREAPHERSFIVELQRDLHTLKGGARMAGLAPIGDLSHAMESVVDAVSDGHLGIDRSVVESLERGFDRLHVLVQRVAHRRAIAMPLHAIARFESLVADHGLFAQQPTHADLRDAAAPAADIVVEAEPRAAVADVGAAPDIPAPRHLTAMDQQDVPHAPQEMIRVRSDLLDSLVNYAGEVSIYRSRLEQQISTFRFNLVEFDQTVSRLRDQLRKLEIETEAQIIARYQREQHDTGTGAFDPLELDRFSQLQQLSRALGESVSDLVSIQGLLDDQTRQSETLLLQQARVSSDLQEGLMRTRMVPFDSLVPNLRRTLRQSAQEVGKHAQLKVEGAHGEMDRNLLERMKAPFEHMLRNALAHGIERPEVRLAAGKPAEGTVSIAVSREATEVVLRVSDDGRGMDRDAIRRQAIERGLLKPEVVLSDRDLYGFVLESGFSTAEHLTQLAGRGVGMDVVHNEIKQLGGSLTIDSTPGQGVTFTIRLPFTLAVTQAILVKLGDSTYAIPMSSVQGVTRIAGDDLERRIAAGDTKHIYVGEEYQIHDLAQLLGVSRGRALDDTQIPLLMTRSGDQRAAVRIDGVVGSREIVVKSVGPQVSSVAGIFGATIMGDGSVVIILDLAPLVRRLVALQARIEDGSAEQPAYLVAAPEPAAAVRQKPLVMVVDDSITMRKVTTRVLERADYEVITAKDGLDALEKLQDSVPDLMLLDIEMPRMDGYELAIYMRNDVRLRQVPIIMITSRTGDKHRQRALEIGVERYLGKPYQEDDLLRHVREILVCERG